MTNDKDITLADMFAHMRVQTVKIDQLTTKVDSLAKDMHEGFEAADKHFKAIDKRFDEVEKRLEHLEQDVFVLIARKSAHEERLDTIEKVQLPKIRKSIRNLQKKPHNTRKPSVQRKTIATAGR